MFSPLFISPFPHDEENDFRIQSFLQELMEILGYGLPSDWPEISNQEYTELRTFLRERVNDLYHYIDNHPKCKPHHKIFTRIFPEISLRLLELDRIRPPALYKEEIEDEGLGTERPQPQLAFEQIFCTPNSSLRRVEQILTSVDPFEGKILLLGDDDLLSLLLTSRFYGEIHVADLDLRILEHINRYAPSVILHHVDFVLGGIPRSLKESFDAVVLSAPFYKSGLWAFLYKALFCLKINADARIFLSLFPIAMEEERKTLVVFWKKLAALGLTCERLHPTFNVYDLRKIKSLEYQELIKIYKAPIESLLLDTCYQAPYIYSDFFELRRLAHTRPQALRKKLLDWWHSLPD